MSILEQIYESQKAAVAAQKQVPSQRPEDLQRAYDLNLAPPLIDFAARLKQSPFKLSLLAEVKRASPSKGIIALDTCAPAQAIEYAQAGASAISVLTEPKWFKGSIEDLRLVRQALAGMPHRPAVLRKEFIFDEYQILEARLAGADTVLLIVKMLDLNTLTRLYKYSQSLGMEPLVEVNTLEELDTAVNLGAKVIGANNRNLTSFEVDTDTTVRLMESVPKDAIFCALSGINSREDVEPYAKIGVGAVLVGEALMRAADTANFIADLLAVKEEEALVSTVQRQPLVKICGTRSPEAAITAVNSGADLIGMILVPGTKRCVANEIALKISEAVHNTPKPGTSSNDSASTLATKHATKAYSFFEHTARHHIVHPQRALLVGVFRNQPLDYVLSQQRVLNLDIVQLHGNEPIEWAALIPCAVMHAFNPGNSQIGVRGHHSITLLDSGAGGTGERLGMEKVIAELGKDRDLRVLLAGGLNPDNVVAAANELGKFKSQVVGIDVSSGVETDGRQDLKKIKAFIAAAKSIRLDVY